MAVKHAFSKPRQNSMTLKQWREDWIKAHNKPEQLNEFCKEPPCASDACRRAGRCLHAS